MKTAISDGYRNPLRVKTLLAAIAASAMLFAAADLPAAPDAVTDIAVASSGFRHVTLTWTAPYDAVSSSSPAYYEIRVSSYRVIVVENDWQNNSTSQEFPYRVVLATSTTRGFTETFNVSGLVNGLAYFFAVKSSTDGLNWSGIDTASPEPQGAPQNSVPGNVSGYNYASPPTQVVFTSAPTLSWGAVTNAGSALRDNNFGDYVASYTLWYSTMSDFFVKSVVENITQTSYVTPPLSENTTYYWGVFAKDSEGLLSTTILQNPRFIVNASSEPPAAPNLISPDDNHIEPADRQPLFSWQASSDPDPGDSVVYDFYISTASDFAASVTTAASSISTTFWAPWWELAENAGYFWKVLARDTSGLLATSATRYLMINTANESPGPFDQYYPVGGVTIFTSSPTLSWIPSVDPDPGDTLTYDIVYSSFDPALGGVPQIFGVPATFYTLEGLAEDTVYWWRAIARDGGGLSSSGISISSFTVNEFNVPPLPFSLLFSSGIVKSDTPVFRWNPATDPDGDEVVYSIFISTRQDFLSYISFTGLSNAFYQPTAGLLTENTTHWWYVTAGDPQNLLTYSSTWYVVIDALDENPAAFSLVSPPDGSYESDLTPLLEWQSTTDPDPLDSIAHYLLEYSTDAAFGPATVVGPLNATYYAFVFALDNNTTYHWRVTAVADITGETTTAARSFVTSNLPPSAAALVYPSGIIPTDTPVFGWSASVDPQGENVFYDLHLSTNPSFDVYVSTLGLTTTYYAVSPALEWEIDYWWRVSSRNQTGTLSVSGTFYFEVRNLPPASFSLVYPTGTITSVSPVFGWTESVDPQGENIFYDLYFSTDSSFGVYVSTLGLNATFYASAPLTENAAYWWKVTARNETGNTANSATFYFIVDAEAEYPTAFSLLSPSDGAVIETQIPLLEWQASVDPDPSGSVVYTLRYSLNDASFSSPVEISGLDSTQYQIPVDSLLEADATYYWRVTARDPTARETSSADGSFRIMPSTRPMAPSDFDVSYDVDTRTAVLSWSAPGFNTDGTAVGSLFSYPVYMAYDYDDVYEVSAVTAAPSSKLTVTLTGVAAGAYFMVRAVNSSGVRGEPSNVVRAGSEIAVLWRDQSGEIRVAGDRENLPSSVTVVITDEELPSDDVRTLRAFSVSARSSDGTVMNAFPSPVSVTVKLPSVAAAPSASPSTASAAAAAIYWFNGTEWISLGGSVDGGFIGAMSVATGSFRMRSVERSSTFRILNAWPKVITPNGDGVNDEFNITFENPLSEKAEGTIYDLTGYNIGVMASKTDSWAYWDGKDRSGAAMPAGIYIYQIKVGSSVKNGTVVVAR